MPTSSASARAWLDHLLTPGWTLLFDDVVPADPLGFPGYRGALDAARAATGESESVLVADGSLGGRRVVVVAFEFGFLGGSMGTAAGERVSRAFEHAAAEGLPLVALTASGGARMQEGMLALAQMPATLAARAALAAAHRPFVAYLRHPTTGGVFASFASTADVIWAQPGATIGFAGPRVAETVTGEALPAGSHTAESAVAAGLAHDLVEPADVSARLAVLLDVVRAPAPANAARPEEPARADTDAWAEVGRARDPSRMRGLAWLDIVTPLRAPGGTGVVEAAIATVAGRAVVAVALTGAGTGRPTPGDYAIACEAIATAERLALPVVTVVDTPGAEPGADSERDGIARAIAQTFEALQAARVPTVACVTGEGGSGGALALAACDRVLVAEHAIFSVIAPEGAAAILRRDDVEQVARDLRLTAHDLRANGLADLVVAEEPDARANLHAAVAWALGDIAAAPTSERARRWRTWSR